MSLILLLETATDICSVGLSRAGELLSLAEIDERADHAAKINELILQACREAGCTLAALDAVAVSTGPGSYTSLRVGTATAKGICFALDKPLIAVDTLGAIARAVRQEPTKKYLYGPMIDARRMEVYTAFYDSNLHLLEAAHPLVVEAGVFDHYLQQGFQVMLAGNGAPKCSAVLPDSILISEVICSAAHLSAPAQEAFHNQAFADLAYYEPFYLKPANITQSKKRL